MRILIIGIPYFTSLLGSLLSGEDIVVDTYELSDSSSPSLDLIPKVLKSDIIHCLWGTISSKNGLYFRLAALSRKKVFMHWLGTDVLKAKQCYEKGDWDRHIIRNVIHWAEASWIAKELEEVGIRAEVVPMTPLEFPQTIPPLPKEFTVLVYLPGDRLKFYGYGYVQRLIEDLPEIKFFLVGTQDKPLSTNYKNVYSLGWVKDMRIVYPQVTVLVRMTEHDGLSFMVRESLAFARHVVWTYPFPGVFAAKNYDDLKKVVMDLWTKHQSHQLALNETGKLFVHQEYEPKKVAKNILKKFHSEKH